MDADRRGFTLLELIAALSLTGIALLGAMLLLDQLGDGAARIGRDGARVARQSNGRRLLDDVAYAAAITGDSLDVFRGDEHSVRLTTVCDVARGWSERCRASIVVDSRDDSSIVLVQLDSGDMYETRRISGSLELRYRYSAPSDSLWARRWSSSSALPAAIGLVAGSDTIVLPIGAARE